MSLAEQAQPGAISDATAFAEYLTFTLRDHDVTPDKVISALDMVANATKSIRQKDPDSQVSSTVGIGARAWPLLFPEADIPEGLTAFEAMSDGDRSFPSTPGDLFVMVKSSRIDLALEVGKYLILGFAPIADCVEDQRGFKYLDDRDLINFVDGTENPRGTERVAAVLVPSGTYAGGTHLLIQTYLDRQAEWNALTIEDQEGVIGRTKFDDIEIPDAEKKPFAHNVKSKVEIDGTEIKMFRQNRAIGTAKEHGTMFVGFAAEASTLTTSLRQMITADADGNYDHLLDFVTATTGAMYFVPPQAFLDAITG